MLCGDLACFLTLLELVECHSSSTSARQQKDEAFCSSSVTHKLTSASRPAEEQGVRASARSLLAAEASVRSGAALMATGVSQHLLPAVRTRVPSARGVCAPSWPTTFAKCR